MSTAEPHKPFKGLGLLKSQTTSHMTSLVTSHVIEAKVSLPAAARIVLHAARLLDARSMMMRQTYFDY